MSSLLSFALSGVFHALLVTKQPVCSYHTFSPLPWWGGLFSVALSLGLPPPAINWHCVFVEPGLSSLKLIKAISHLSGMFKVFIIWDFSRKNNYLINLLILSAIIRHSLSIFPFINFCLNLLWKLLKSFVFWLFFKFLVKYPILLRYFIKQKIFRNWNFK